jgi:hypothetical protein
MNLKKQRRIHLRGDTNTGFDIPTAATMNSRFFWVVTKCSSGKPGVSEKIVPTCRVEGRANQEKENDRRQEQPLGKSMTFRRNISHLILELAS